MSRTLGANRFVDHPEASRYFRRHGGRKGMSKIRDGASLDSALEQFDSRPHAPLERYSDHMTDALLTAAWLRTVAHEPQLWSPAGLNAVAATEGWTFGVR